MLEIEKLFAYRFFCSHIYTVSKVGSLLKNPVSRQPDVRFNFKNQGFSCQNSVWRFPCFKISLLGYNLFSRFLLVELAVCPRVQSLKKRMKIIDEAAFRMSQLTERVHDYFSAESMSDWSNRRMSESFQHLTAEELDQIAAEIEQRQSQLGDVEFGQRCERLMPYLAESSRLIGATNPKILARIQRLYMATPPESNLRNGWLYWLAVMGGEALTVWLDLISQSPPESRRGIVWAFAPLLKNEALTESFLDELLNAALGHRQLAGVALDLTNFQFREGIRKVHCAAARVQGLSHLMSSVAQQLARIEEGHAPPSFEPYQISQMVGDSVSLLVSLCDLMGLCDYRDAEGKLRQVAELRHRRVQTEAAAALARLGIDDGKEQLLKLIAEPSIRMRALNYAIELGMESEVDEQFRTPAAVAESQMAMWLAEPQQMGIAPSKVDVIDQRRLFWPGFDNPIDCFLVRFVFGVPPQQYSNIGIVGPMTFAFDFDVSTLSFDDLYASFAGWQAQHEELHELSLDEAYRLRDREIQRQICRLEEDDFEEIQPKFVAYFFGEWILVATAKHNENQGTAIVDDTQLHWFVDNGPGANSEFAYLVYRGRRLLTTFNDAPE